MIYLLDVNVLVGLLDPRHTLHSAAHQWFGKTVGPHDRWATCAITENGFLRVGSAARYAGVTQSPFESLMLALTEICQMPNHEFWVLDQSIRTILPTGVALSPKQITDIYLLGIALAHRGMFATFDGKIPARLLPSGEDALEVIPVAPDLVP